MADDADVASDYEERHRASALASITKQVETESLEHCVKCGDDIPVERQAFGGVTLCVHCKTVEEARSRR